ncbi:hypothetical protein D3C81_1275200 [compost metagenome]
MLLHGHGRVLGGLAFGTAGRQAGHLVQRVAGEEERYRIALPARAVDHPVQRGDVAVIGPAREQVTDIDDEGAGHGRGIDPAGLEGVPDL